MPRAPTHSASTHAMLTRSRDSTTTLRPITRSISASRRASTAKVSSISLKTRTSTSAPSRRTSTGASSHRTSTSASFRRTSTSASIRRTSGARQINTGLRLSSPLSSLPSSPAPQTPRLQDATNSPWSSPLSPLPLTPVTKSCLPGAHTSFGFYPASPSPPFNDNGSAVLTPLALEEETCLVVAEDAFAAANATSASSAAEDENNEYERDAILPTPSVNMVEQGPDGEVQYTAEYLARMEAIRAVPPMSPVREDWRRKPWSPNEGKRGYRRAKRSQF
ncbi:hypothetical protein MKEN_01367700 [Mycena kentingensis (nom. inval.)]|nr:hypothetical protein MKEN_01367700 [Mycena kentingensis (nom. inval.)]